MLRNAFTSCLRYDLIYILQDVFVQGGEVYNLIVRDNPIITQMERLSRWGLFVCYMQP
jgi:hypothetical protein